MSNSLFFMERAVNFIIEGSLSDLENALIGTLDINRILLPDRAIIPVPSVSGVSVCHSICGPTMIILAVLCERPDFVKLLLSYDPDLSLKVNGYNALHYSALTKDPECLKVLLTCPFYQKRISMPISEPNQKKSTTNSLHIAVSNMNIASAALLLEELPKSVIYFQKTKNAKTTSNNKEGGEEEDIDNNQTINGIDVNSITTNGSSPLHIAAYMRDINMCRLLLNYSVDISIKDSKGRTAADIAFSSHSKIGDKIGNLLKKIPDEIPKALFQKKYPIDKNFSNTTIQIINHSTDKTSADNDKKSKKKRGTSSSSSSDSSSDSESDSDSDDSSKKKKKKTKVDKETQFLLKKMLSKIDSLSTRIGLLEDSVSHLIDPPPCIQTQVLATHQCMGCKSSETRMCPTCHNYFCSKCMNMPTIHNCI